MSGDGGQGTHSEELNIEDKYWKTQDSVRLKYKIRKECVLWGGGTRQGKNLV